MHGGMPTNDAGAVGYLNKQGINQILVNYNGLVAKLGFKASGC